MPIPQDILNKIASNDKKLVELNLSRQLPPLTDKDMQELAPVLERNRIIKKIILCENEIGDQGAIILANVLLYNPSIETLDLSVNTLTNEGALALLRIPTLKELDIAANNLNNEVVPSFLENKTLIFLIIDGNTISQNSINKVNEHLQENAIHEIFRRFQQILEITQRILPPDKQALVKRELLSSIDQRLTTSFQVGPLSETPTSFLK